VRFHPVFVRFRQGLSEFNFAGFNLLDGSLLICPILLRLIVSPTPKAAFRDLAFTMRNTLAFVHFLNVFNFKNLLASIASWPAILRLSSLQSI
jgi:uncharacterized membrane protein